MTKILRTPDERFNNLPGFPYLPHYIDDLEGFKDMRMHYIDEGPQDAENVFLCLHGQPTWSYLYRKMIPVFVSAGHRVVAMDFFGFGRSDKPVDDETYTFEFYRNSIISFIKKLDLNKITLVCQDWGGFAGLTIPMDMPQRFSRLLIMNTMLTTGDLSELKGFLSFRDWSSKNVNYDVAFLLKTQAPHLTKDELDAYRAPFPDDTYKGGVRRFPFIVPDNPDDVGAQLSQRAQEYLSKDWIGESFMAIGMQDFVLGPPVMNALRKMIKNCPEPYEVADARHFVQEWGEEVAKKALEAFK